jgi:hypothetical protein
MTDRAQFEAMLEALINDDQQAAKEIFHNIVVGKSREIYEELLAEDFDQPVEEEGEEAEAPVAEEAEEEGDDAPFGGDDEGDDEEGEEGDEEGEENPFGDEEGGDEEGEGGDIEDRVMDLEDALDELKAEFEQLMAGEEGEEHMGGDEFGGDDMGGDIDMGGDDLEMEDELAPMMEYVDKVALPKHGDNGVNTRSAVAGKNDMGGTTANIAKSFSTEKGGTQGGLLKPTTQPQDGGNINKPGANAGKTAFKKKEPGHGAEKKGQAEKADNTNSMINGAPKRAK